MKKILGAFVAVAFVAVAAPTLADDVETAAKDTGDWTKKAADDTAEAAKKAVK